jgi:hypothetical protein
MVSPVCAEDAGVLLGGHMYLLVEESFAHGAGGARDGRNGLGWCVRHSGGVCESNWSSRGVWREEMGGRAVVLMQAQLSDVKLRQ